MSGLSQKANGYSLIEISLAIGILGLLIAITVPFLTQKRGDQRTEFTHNLSGLVRNAYVASAQSGYMHKVLFDLKNQKVFLQRAEKPGQHERTIKFSDYHGGIPSRIAIPNGVKITKFVVNGTDEISGDDTKKLWFFVSDQGIIQAVTMALEYESGQAITFIIDPFSHQFVRQSA